ncbi:MULTISPECIES: hypothetical protein [unclassified Acidovorax]|uniref:hypothetical protein n=1 Tax=unclassified Acidovorax TaxID=2684926 RepID=UPI001C46B9A8|nr:MULTISPECIES: hypothetical protein [unclassified Acidovorax]MBV7427303.1 hypothetical protein [Acidovorax sp. sif0732]MBV7448427.1 hypothetical protein [Acidovorax sp. sif0715]
MTTTISIHIIDRGEFGVLVCTTAGTPYPLPGHPATPGQRLATDLLAQAAARASDVHYWQPADKPLEFVRSLLDPERNGWAVSEMIRDEARQVLGIPRVQTAGSAA